MNCRYGGPGLAYANFERQDPLVRRVPSDMSGYGELEIMDGYGIVAAAPLIAGAAGATVLGRALNRTTARRLSRLKRQLAKKQRSVRRAKGLRKRILQGQIKRLKRQIAQIVKRARKQIAKRRSKGKKLGKRLRRLQSASPRLAKARKRRFQGRSSTAPFWFMRGQPSSVRDARWRSMSKQQRRIAFLKFRRAQRRRQEQQAQSRSRRGRGQLLGPAPFPRRRQRPMDDGFRSQSAFDQNDITSTTGQDLVAMPEFTESDTGLDEGMEEDFDTMEMAAETPKKNRTLLVVGGLAAAGAIAYLVMKKKKPAGGKKKKKKDRAR